MVKNVNIDEIKALIVSLRDTNPSLVNIQTVCDKLESFVADVELTLDLSTKIDGLTDKITLLQTVDGNLKDRVAKLENELSSKKDQLFLTDEQYRMMIKQISSVLSGLEDYLRRHA